MRSKPLATGALGALALIVAPAAVAGGNNGGFTPVDPVSPPADGIYDSYLWVAIFTGAILIAVEGALIWFVIRYRRRRRDDDREGPQIHGNTRLEVAWTVVPVIILAAIGSFVFIKLPGIRDVPSANAEGGRTDVDVIGYRFYWQIEYPNGAIAVDRMRAPLGGNMALSITAPDWDVVHSWWIPALGGKFDAIPGVTNEMWFRAERRGVFGGKCAELCGIQHARMTAAVEVLPQDEYEAWLEARADGEGLGEETFRGACAKCHGLQGEGDIGPPLAGSATLASAESVERVVRNGQNEMPPVGRDWGEQQMDALIEYLQDEVADGQ